MQITIDTGDSAITIEAKIYGASPNMPISEAILLKPGVYTFVIDKVTETYKRPKV